MTGSGRELGSEKIRNLYFAKNCCWDDDVREEEKRLAHKTYWVNEKYILEIIGNLRKREVRSLA